MYRRRIEEGDPARSFRTLLADLKTLTWNQVRVEGSEVTFEKYAAPTPLQRKAFDLLDMSFRL